ncbi:MAG: MTH895/ArsE family thioredoxin-like protein [Bacillota bacterium]
MEEKQKHFFTVSEAARFLGVTPLTIRRYIYRGLLYSSPTPGGHHRIDAQELAELQAGSRNTKTINPSPCEQGSFSCMSRFQLLEKEVELLKKQLSVVSCGCIKLKEMVDTPQTRQRIVEDRTTLIVLGPGCQACDSLAQLAKDVIWDLKFDGMEVRHIKEMEIIAEYGPLLTPALVLDGNVMVSGVVPSKEQLAALLKAKLQ